MSSKNNSKSNALNYVGPQFPERRDSGVPISQKIRSISLIDKFDLIPVLSVVAIVNTFYFIGIALVNFIGEASLPALEISSLDMGILFLALNWINALTSPLLAGSLIIGWIVASIWAKKKYGDRYSRIVIIGTQLPLILLFVFSIGIVLIILPILGLAAFALLQIMLLVTAVVGVLSLLFALAGLFIASFFSYDESIEFNAGNDPEYLILNVVPPTPNEKIEYCPFRMKDKPGCSFLGYQAPNQPLICDYKSTYLRCTVYSHIFESIMEGFDK